MKKIFEKLAVEGANPIPVPVEAAANPYEQAAVVEDQNFDAFEFADEKDVLKKYDEAW